MVCHFSLLCVERADAPCIDAATIALLATRASQGVPNRISASAIPGQGRHLIATVRAARHLGVGVTPITARRSRFE
jgi:hypothetical protein